LAAVTAAKGDIPHIGKCDVKWVNNTDIPIDAFPAVVDPEEEDEGGVGGWNKMMNDDADDMDVLNDTPTEAGYTEREAGQDVNYDVAD